jgi:hypothetical protein
MESTSFFLSSLSVFSFLLNAALLLLLAHIAHTESETEVMGVDGLWDFVECVEEVLDLHSLRGQKIAVDGRFLSSSICAFLPSFIPSFICAFRPSKTQLKAGCMVWTLVERSFQRGASTRKKRSPSRPYFENSRITPGWASN